MAQALSKAEKLEKVRAKARAAGKVPASDKKKSPKKDLSQKEKDLAEIDRYNIQYRKGKKKDDRPLSSLGGYGKTNSTATSGGSKAVRKIDPKFNGKTTPAKTGNDLVDRLRRKPFKYLK